MSLKDIAREILPEAWYDQGKLMICQHNSSLNFDQVERKVDKEHLATSGTKVNWKHPLTYTEKIDVSKIYMVNQEKADLSDKLAVRDWITAKIGSQYLVPIIGVYDNFESIDFNKLPNQFVIKCNHDSASVTVVKDKSLIRGKTYARLKQKYDLFFLRRDYAYKGFEMHYSLINPKIIIEPFLGENISDYKFLCFGGVARYCWVDFDRFTNHKRNIYDMNWNLQVFNQWKYGNYNKPVDPPMEFEEMKNIVFELCKGFPHVRVDLYDINGKVYFGEMTFTNGNGAEMISPPEWDRKLGDMWPFDYSAREKVRSKVSSPSEYITSIKNSNI